MNNEILKICDKVNVRRALDIKPGHCLQGYRDTGILKIFLCGRTRSYNTQVDNISAISKQ